MNTLTHLNHYAYLFIATGLFFGLGACQKNESDNTISSQTLSVMSYNIRYDNPGDSLNSWDHRKKQLVNEVLFYNPDFMGIQEGLDHQVHYLAAHLSNRKYIGVGRKDGKKKGEYSAIFYNTKRFSLVPGTDSTMWLSETPGKPSTGWDAALPRIVTWGEFQSKATGKKLYVFNTHFDHRGETARAKSAKLILETINKIAGGMPVVLTGDFNVTEQKKPYKIITNSFMNDAWHTSKLDPVGPEFTYAGFEVCDSSTHRARIDYIFVNNLLDVNKIAAISNFRDGHFLSDHLPVYSELTWNK